MKMKLAPSMMCCDFFRIRQQVTAFEACNIDLLHIDIMDGNFVPNFALGTEFVKQLKAATDIPLDIHLMTEMPEKHINSFPISQGDYVSVHYETTKHLQKVLQTIAEKGAIPLLALNPGTPIEAATEVLDEIGGLLIMTVNPGFAGQKMVPHSIQKIQRAKNFLEANGRPDLEIEVDGNVSIANAIQMKNAGANIFVAGTSAVFCGNSIEDNIKTFRNSVFR